MTKRPRPGTAVWIRPHPSSRPMCGLTEGMARVVSGYPDGWSAFVSYRTRLAGVSHLLGDGPVLCEQGGVTVLVHPSEIVAAVGVVDSCGPREAVRLVLCPRCQRPYEAGRPCRGCGERRWTDTLPHLDGGAKV